MKKGLFTPTQVLAIGFIMIILVGAVLLSLPISTIDGKGTPFLTALFTSTSATCVTGLVLVDTGTYFSIFGQLIILFLIQVGGLGFMTFATLIAIILGRKITLKDRMVLQEALNKGTLDGVVRLVRQVIEITFVIEGVGALVLSLRLAQEMNWYKAVYFGIFHAVSAFNNAGIDLFGHFNSLTQYAGDIVINITIASLIILGGLGFVVISEVLIHKGKKLSLHSLVVLKATLGLIVIATALIFLSEFTNPLTMGNVNLKTKVLSSFFQGVVPRTAGFNTIALSEMRTITQLLIIILMFIGAAPGSTGGGIKVTTFVTLFLYIRASYQGKSETTIMERTLPHDLVQKAVTLTFLAGVLILVITATLTLTEKADFITLLFETMSAFGTVGLSLGVTPKLSPAGQIAIILTMYIGRVGPLTLAYAFAQKRLASLPQVKYPEERILIG